MNRLCHRALYAFLALAFFLCASSAGADPLPDDTDAAASAATSPPASVATDFNAPHGSMHYRPVRAAAPPTIDGVLDEPVWREAPRDSRFASLYSKPYGLPSAEPTVVQAAYDEQYLYVAFRCAYSAPGARDNGVPPDENTLLSQSEGVFVAIDPRHDHSNARLFEVGRTGARVDLEWTNNGNATNLDWRGIWDVATRHDEDQWTAEFAIPWGTIGLPAHDEPFDVGINFARRTPSGAEFGLWSLQPPSVSALAMTYFGHLEGLSHVHPSQRLFIQPYVAAAVRQDNGAPLSALRDFSGTGGNVGVYGGFYARYRPSGPVQLDATMNPDFSAVSPDQAVTNLDRFELSFPEVRPFFAEDRPRFEFGSGTSQLFYSRRVGLALDPNTNAYKDVPILYGAKTVVRSNDTEVAAMNVGLTTADPRVSFADSVSVVRLNHFFGKGIRLGNIFINRFGDTSHYNATGIDGVYTMFDEHVTFAGFLARTTTAGAAPGGAGRMAIGWQSQEFYASAAYLDVGTAFDPQLGYYPLTGIRSTQLAMSYTPVIHNDLVRQIFFDASLDRTKNRDDTKVYDRGSLNAYGDLSNNGFVVAKLQPALEVVATDFKIAGNRINVPAGRYDVMVVQFAAGTPPRRTVEGTVYYTEGDLFGGYRRVPSVKLGLNLGRFAGSALYELYLLRYGTQELTGHRLSTRATFTYTPLARSTLVVEANTLNLRSVVQLVNAYTFGQLSTLSLVMSETTGADLNNPTDVSWYGHPNLTAVVSFAYGMTPF